MIKVLITGSTGFVGQHLTTYLSGIGIGVYSLNRANQINTEGKTYGDFRWNNFNLDNLDDINTIIHLAGKAHDLKKTVNDEEYFVVNTELTKRLFDLFLKSGASNFIYFSSVKAVADSVKGVLREDTTPNPQTPYGRSKQQAETYLLSHILPENKRVFILRPCMMHGPGNKGNLNLLYKVVKKGIPYPLASFSNARSFLSISNLNFIIEKLLANPAIPGGIYNMADDAALSTNELINIIADASGHKSKLWKISPSLVKSLAGIGDVLHLPLNSERLKKLTESYVVSNEKISQVLGITSLPTSSRDGLIATIKSFGQN